MQSAAEQWLALRHLAVTSLFMCIATIIAIFTSDISKYFKQGVDKGKTEFLFAKYQKTNRNKRKQNKPPLSQTQTRFVGRCSS